MTCCAFVSWNSWELVGITALAIAVLLAVIFYAITKGQGRSDY